MASQVRVVERIVQQDFQPIIVGEGRDSVVQRITLIDYGLYAQRTS